MEANGRKWMQKALVAMLLVLSLFLVSGSLVNGLEPTQNVAHAAEDSGKDKDSDKEKKDKEKSTSEDKKKEDKEDSSSKESESEDKKDQKSNNVSKSYAAFVFDNADKNQSMFYFASDAPKGAPSVESVVNYANQNTGGKGVFTKAKDFISDFFKDSGEGKFDSRKYTGGQGLAYASFLKTLHDWGLYHTYTNSLQVGKGVVGDLFVGGYGAFLVGLIWIAKSLDSIMVAFAHLMQKLNLFNYIAPGGQIPKSSPVRGLQPLVDLFHQLGQIGMIALALMFGVLMFVTIAGIGKARNNRGGYFVKGLGLRLAQAFAIIGLPFMLAGFLTSFANAIIDGEGGGNSKYIQSAVEDIPKGYIVDTSGWVNSSLKNMNVDNGLNGGYVLKKGNAKFPTKGASEINKGVPNQTFVKAINKIADPNDKKSGIDLLNEWRTADTFTPKDLDTMYKVSDSDKKHWWNKDEKRLYQFKLSPQEDTVKTFSGKDGVISLDLNEVSIKSASLAGNSALGVFLNGLSMGIQIFCIVFVAIVMMTAVVIGVFKSIVLLATNVSKAQIGSFQALLGVLATCVMLVVTVFTALLMIGMYSTLSQGLVSSLSDSINRSLAKNTPGVVKQIVSVTITGLVQILGVILVFKMRSAIVQGVQEFLSNVMHRAGIDISGKKSGVKPAGVNALETMADANDDGQGLATGSMAALAAGAGATGLSAAYGMRDGIQDKDFTPGRGADIGKEALKEGLNKFSSSAGGRLGSYANDKDNKNTLTGKIAGNLSQALDKVNDAIQDGSTGDQLDAQEAKADEAEDAITDADKARDNLDDLRNKRAEMEAAGASDEELAEMDDKIAEAENELRDAEAKEANAANDLAQTGAANELNEEAMEETEQDERDAEHALNEAKRELQDLEDEREAMEAAGASDEELAEMDEKIANAQNKVDDAQDKFDMVKNRGEGIVDRDNINDAENDQIAAKQGLRDSERELQSAEETGNLTSDQVAQMNNTAEGFKHDLDDMHGLASSKLQNDQDKLAAMERVNELGGSFSDKDVQSQSEAVATAANAVTAAENNLQQLKKSGASKSAIQQAERELSNAKTDLANAKEVQGSMATGSLSKDVIESQSGYSRDLAAKASGAEQKVAQLEQDQASGKAVSTETLNQARNVATQARNEASTAEAVSQAIKSSGGQVTSGMVQSQSDHVKHVQNRLSNAKQALALLEQQQANGENVSPQQMQQAKSNVQLAQSQLSTASTTLDTMQQQMNGGKVTSNMFASQGAKVQSLEQKYDKAQSNLSNLQQQKANGISVNARALQQAQQEVAQTGSQLSSARSIYNGLNAQRLTGGQVSKDAVMRQRAAVKDGKSHVNQLNNARDNMSNISTAKSLNRKSMASMAMASQFVQNNAKDNVTQAQSSYDSQAKGLRKLQNLYNKPGSNITMSQITKKQAAVEQAKNNLMQAKHRQGNIDSQVQGIRSVGTSMKDNIQTATQNVATRRSNLQSAQGRYQQFGKTGGMNLNTMNKIKQSVAEDRSIYENDKQNRTDEYAKRKRKVKQHADLRKENRIRKGRMRDGTSNEFWA